MEKQMQTAKEMEITKERYIAVLERNMELENQVLELNRCLTRTLARCEEVCDMAEELYKKLETARNYLRKQRDENGNDEYFRV